MKRSLLVLATLLVASCARVSSAPTPTPTATSVGSPTAPVPSPTPTETVAAGFSRYTNTELGYSVDLPAGWRRATCSPEVVTTSPLMATEFFVGVPDTAEIISAGTPVIQVRVVPSEGLTPLLWLERNESQPDVRFETVTLGGNAGARGVLSATGEVVAIGFATRGSIYAISRPYFGVADPEMERMLVTLRVLDNPTGRGPTPPPTPRSIESVVDALADGFARKDANAIAETMRPCITFGAVPGDPDIRSRATFVTSLGLAYAAGTSIQVLSRPIENDQYLGPFVRSTWSKPGEPDQRVDFLLRAQGDRWSVVAVRPRT
jgi:hypothetical protein